ncbi:hypothetical protein NEOCIP111885_01304 [Pseudoneobacillus rhizosphaerae]|uniref:Uncharacterized protein n=1 Tax=Pseudoneobacillus rhizosphaerae TaxID=2880968 RepID=A0A9C7G8P7_9BACI|nr:hypothetical protein NEOCIP111885_01304 [Pseudoneobacillus rhizosphaerae]
MLRFEVEEPSPFFYKGSFANIVAFRNHVDPVRNLTSWHLFVSSSYKILPKQEDTFKIGPNINKVFEKSLYKSDEH